MMPDEIKRRYPLALAGDAEAMAAMADAMGARAGLQGGDIRDGVPDQPWTWLEWNGIFFNSTEKSKFWDFHGRYAPLRSVDCALSIRRPRRHNLAIETVACGWAVTWSLGRSGMPGTNGTLRTKTLAQLPVAITAATLFAWAYVEASHDA